MIRDLCERLQANVGMEERSVCRFGSAGEFSIRLAASEEDRRRAWALAYRVYREKEYAEPNPQGLWYSIFDALSVTVLIERQEATDYRPQATGCRMRGFGIRLSDHEDPKPEAQGPKPAVLIGAVTVVPDSPLGLPADASFPEETARLRASGARLAEAVSLVQAGVSERAGMTVVAKLCEFTCLVARHLLGATDLVITVNPRHEDYYSRVMLFDRRGELASCGKVSDAPAVFLTLNFSDMEGHIRNAALPDAPRTIYRRFMKPPEDRVIAERLRRQHRPLDEAALSKYFVEARPLLSRETPERRAYVESCYRTVAIGVG